MSDSAGFGIVPRHLRRRLTSNEIAVYVALSWRVDEHGNCWPSHRTLAEDAGMSERTAQRTLVTLVDKGVISKRPQFTAEGDRKANLYHLNIWWRPMGVVSQSHHPGVRLAE